MRAKLTLEEEAALAEVIQAVTVALEGTEGRLRAVHINTQRICDRCQDATKEAFPFGWTDTSGRVWGDLCNECWDEIEWPEEELSEQEYESKWEDEYGDGLDDDVRLCSVCKSVEVWPGDVCLGCRKQAWADKYVPGER